MKTLSEIAVENIPDALYPDEILPAREQHLVNLERRGFVDGACYMSKELLRWRDPNVELPENTNGVLLKLENENGHVRYTVRRYVYGRVWGHPLPFGYNVVGWRPIYDNHELIE